MPYIENNFSFGTGDIFLITHVKRQYSWKLINNIDISSNKLYNKSHIYLLIITNYFRMHNNPLFMCVIYGDGHSPKYNNKGMIKMKNVIKKIASIAMAFTLLGTGTNVTRTISPKSNNTLVASASCRGNNHRRTYRTNIFKKGKAVGDYGVTYYRYGASLCCACNEIISLGKKNDFVVIKNETWNKLMRQGKITYIVDGVWYMINESAIRDKFCPYSY